MDPNFLVQSIKIPQGKLLKLYNMEKLQGKSAVFKKSVQCLDKVEFSMFAQLGISLLEEGEELQQNVLEENKKFFLLKRD
jgi:membrane protein YdbS with pleckstrin-like domain